MTTASELFHNRRYRFGRNTDSNFDIVSDLPSPNSHRHRSHRGRDRLDPDIFQPPPSRRHRHVYNPSQERESSRIELGGQEFGSSNVNVSHSGSSNVRDRSRLSTNERLPGAVLLARERLLQRLTSVTLSTSRRSNRSSSSNQHNNVVTSDDFRLVDAADWETVLSSEWLAAITPLTESVDHNITKRSPGLTQEEVNCLHVEIFNDPKEDDASKALTECSICLESFVEGDELACLPCGHRYHFSCLGPWVRTCGDCPYCRRGIDVSNGGK